MSRLRSQPNWKRHSKRMALSLFFAREKKRDGEFVLAPDYIADNSNLASIVSLLSDGETIGLEDGVYADNVITLDQANTKMYAINPGQVSFTGSSMITISGTNNEAKGFLFDTIDSSDAIARFVDAQSGKLYNCKFDSCGTDAYKYRQIIQVHRSNGSVIERNHMTSNNAMGIGVVLKTGQTVPTNTVVQNNYFENITSDTSKECVQIGQGDRYTENTNTLVMSNIFKNVNGDPETISVKTGSNFITDNLLIDSEGYIVLRQGSGSTVTNNCVARCPIGIRVHGQNHAISNNMLVENTTGLSIPAGASTFAGNNALHEAASSCTFNANALVANDTSYHFDDWYDGGTYDTYPSNNTFTSDLVSKLTAGTLITEAQDVFTWMNNNFVDLDWILSSTPDTRFTLIDTYGEYINKLASQFTELKYSDYQLNFSEYGDALYRRMLPYVGTTW